MALHVCARPYATHYVSSRYPSKKKEIGVSDLLVWAYRDELVHAARPEGVPAEWVSGGGSARLGFGAGFETDIVESSVNLGFTAAADAYRVHRAVSALSAVEVQLPVSELGVGHGIDMARGAMPEIERSFTVKRSGLVMTSAIDGHSPDWMEKPVIVVERGKLLYQHDRKGRIMRDRVGRAVELVQLVSFVGDLPWTVAKARRIYGVWWAALLALRTSLIGEDMERFVLTDGMPVRAPWNVVARGA